MESGFPILLADENGERLTPSVVHFPEVGRAIVGRAALRARALAPRTTIYSIKRLMGMGADEVKKLRVDYEIAKGKKGLAEVCIRDREFSPEEISALILQLDDGLVEVLATNGNTHLGGDDIDNEIIEYVIARSDAAMEAGDIARLREVVIDAKHRLSFEENATIRLPFLSGTNLEMELTRAGLDKIAQPVVERTRWHCARALADAKLKPEELDEVILVGGTTKMPLVRRFVREL